MLIGKKKFGEHEGKDIYSYALDNNNGLVAEILNYGGIVKNLVYKGVDVVLGYDNLDGYVDSSNYFGALIGRNSNRIENAEFELNGKLYKLFKNSGINNLHGGKVGFSDRVWDARMINENEPSLELSLYSKDGEEGFPGNVNVTVTYTLTSNNCLKILYEAVADKDTVLNMTNHSYFNLNGHGNGDIKGHSFWLNSDFFTPNTEDFVPNGEILSVKNTPFDFSTESVLKQSIESEHEQIKIYNGLDHNFVLNGRGYRKVSKLSGDKSGIAMELYTDKCGVQIYTSNQLKEERDCKEGKTYGRQSGICLETQDFPNGLKFSHFPDMILKKGEKYESVTTFKFL